MGTYYIPRNYKGESRILYIFTVKSLITTAIGAGVGALFFVLFSAIGIKEQHLVRGSEQNGLKLTSPEDIELFKALLHSSKETWLK